MTHGTSFQWRLREILNGTDCLTEAEMASVDGVSLLQAAEREIDEDEFGEYIEEINEFKFGI